MRAEFEILHRPVETVAPVLQAALSSHGEMALRPRQHLLIITDTAEALDTIRKLVRQVDVPLRRLEIIFKLIEASNTPEPKPSIAEEIRDVGSRLKNILRFTDYELLDKAVLESLEGATAEIRLAGGRYKVRFDLDYLLENGRIIPVKSFRLDKVSDSRLIKKGMPSKTQGPRFQNLLSTALNLIDGEEIIFGASRADGESNKSLIMVLTVRVL